MLFSANLDQTRIETLENRVQPIETFLQNSDWLKTTAIAVAAVLAVR
jgi:hypothetical protein